MVSLSGGNPAIQPFGDLIARGHEKGYRFALETQGSLPATGRRSRRSGAQSQAALEADGRPTGKPGTTVAAVLGASRRRCWKFVVFDERDYAYARRPRPPAGSARLSAARQSYAAARRPRRTRRSISTGVMDGCAGWSTGVVADRWFERGSCRNCMSSSGATGEAFEAAVTCLVRPQHADPNSRRTACGPPPGPKRPPRGEPASGPDLRRP